MIFERSQVSSAIKPELVRQRTLLLCIVETPRTNATSEVEEEIRSREGCGDHATMLVLFWGRPKSPLGGLGGFRLRCNIGGLSIFPERHSLAKYTTAAFDS